MVFKRTKVIRRADHPVSRKNIDPDALRVMQRLHQHGYKAYLVGGSVRDLILGMHPKDFDISTDAEPQQIKRLFRNCFLVGRRFRLAHIRFGYNKVIETSTFRRQPEAAGEGESLVQWDDNQFGTPVEDAFRRDFTVNGLFYDLSDFSVIDHVGGLQDLRRGLIRSIGDPNMRFREDPVRMIRAVRFAARLGFRLEARTRRALVRHAPEILSASPARLLDEVFKLFGFGAGEPAFRLLWELGLLRVLLPELDAYVAATGGRHSPLWRRLAALDSGEHWADRAPSSLMLAVLFEAPARAAVEAARSSGHEVAGVLQDWLEPIVLRLRIPKVGRYRVLRLMEDQILLDQALAAKAPGKRSRRYAPSRIMAHASFPESLALLEIRAASGQAEASVLEYWRQKAESHAEQHPVEEGQAEEGAAAAVAPVKRRRRRRRRSPAHEA